MGIYSLVYFTNTPRSPLAVYPGNRLDHDILGDSWSCLASGNSIHDDDCCRGNIFSVNFEDNFYVFGLKMNIRREEICLSALVCPIPSKSGCFRKKHTQK